MMALRQYVTEVYRSYYMYLNDTQSMWTTDTVMFSPVNGLFAQWEYGQGLCGVPAGGCH